jgi:Trypsin-like peptidase domain
MGFPRIQLKMRAVILGLVSLALLAGLPQSFLVGEGLAYGVGIRSVKDSGCQKLPISIDILSGERAKLVGAAVAVRRSLVVLVCDDSHASGFIISPRHRLVVTAGHVADLLVGRDSLFVVLEGNTEFRRVERVWYHPRIKRVLDFGLYATSFDKRDGPISLYSPDLAVVQLSNDGERIPDGSEARVDVGSNLAVDTLVGVLGYWNNDKVVTPTETKPATANFAIGTVCPAIPRVGIVQPSFKEFFLTKGAANPGASGGPVFLSDGRVVGVIMGAERDSGSPEHPGLGFGAPIAELDELVAYHRLQAWVPGPAKTVTQRLDWGPDPRIGEFRRAVVQVHRARELRLCGRYTNAVEVCNEVLATTPEHRGALMERSKSYLYFLATRWGRLTIDERRRYARWALDDSQQCDRLDSAGNDVIIINLQNYMYDAVVRLDQSSFQFLVGATTRLLGMDWPGEPLSEHERSWVFSIRAQAHHFLHEIELARDDYDKSIRIEPEDPRWYLNRAQFWESCDRPELGRLDREMCEKITQKKNVNVKLKGDIPK